MYDLSIPQPIMQVPNGMDLITEVHEVFPLITWEYISGSDGFVVWGDILPTLGVLISHSSKETLATLAANPTTGHWLGDILRLDQATPGEIHEWVWDKMFGFVRKCFQMFRAMSGFNTPLITVGDFDEVFALPKVERTDNRDHFVGRAAKRTQDATDLISLSEGASILTGLEGSGKTTLATRIARDAIALHRQTIIYSTNAKDAPMIEGARLMWPSDLRERLWVQVCDKQDAGTFLKSLAKMLTNHVTEPTMVILDLDWFPLGAQAAQLGMQLRKPVLCVGTSRNVHPINGVTGAVNQQALTSANQVAFIERIFGGIKILKSRHSTYQGRYIIEGP